jgi:Fur family transcriptional regulator, ferric uptake regulator
MAHLTSVEADDLLERFHHYLREHRLPVTRQRDLIAHAIFTAPDHLTAAAVHQRLTRDGNRIGVATVYRTLDLLVESGLIRLHEFGDGFRRYEGATPQGSHGHLVCAECRAVEEFTNERLERMLPIIADEHHFRHRRHRVEVHGTCRDCQRRALEAL